MGACACADPPGCPLLPRGWVSHPDPQQHRANTPALPQESFGAGGPAPRGEPGSTHPCPLRPKAAWGRDLHPLPPLRTTAPWLWALHAALLTSCRLLPRLAVPDSFEERCGAASNLTLPAASPPQPQPLLAATCTAPHPHAGTPGVSNPSTRDGPALANAATTGAPGTWEVLVWWHWVPGRPWGQGEEGPGARWGQHGVRMLPASCPTPATQLCLLPRLRARGGQGLLAAPCLVGCMGPPPYIPPSSHSGRLTVHKECTCLSHHLPVPPGMVLPKSAPEPSKVVPGIAKTWPSAGARCDPPTWQQLPPQLPSHETMGSCRCQCVR